MQISSFRHLSRMQMLSFLREWAWLAFLVTALGIADVSTQWLSQYSANLGSIWLANAVIVATVMRTPTQRWVMVLPVAFAVLVAGELSMDNSFVLSE